MLVEDLQNYRQQFLSIKTAAQNQLADLTEEQLNWQPGSHQWSIAQCLDHLLVTGHNSLSHIHQAIVEARSKELYSQGPFRYGFIERWFVRQMEAGARMKFKAPEPYQPAAGRFACDIVSRFADLQVEFLECLENANGLDLSRIKVKNPVSRWLQLSLGQELAFNLAHERRHLLQAARVAELPGFPRRSTVV